MNLWRVDKTAWTALGTASIGLVGLVFGVLSAAGINVSQELQDAITAFLGGVMTFAGAVWLVWGMAKGRAVEVSTGQGVVLAGPANELPTGTVVRENLGDELPDQREG